MVLNFIYVVARKVYKSKFQEWDIARHLVLCALSNRYFITKRTNRQLSLVLKKRGWQHWSAREVMGVQLRAGESLTQFP